MKNLVYTFLSLSLSLSLFSCASVDKMVERGDYDGAIQVATKKLAGKKKKEDVYKRQGLEEVTPYLIILLMIRED